MLIESETSRLVDIFAYVVGNMKFWTFSGAAVLPRQSWHANKSTPATISTACIYLSCNLPRVCKPQYHQFCVVSVPCPSFVPVLDPEKVEGIGKS